MRPNVNTQTALTLPGHIPLQKGVGPGDEASELWDPLSTRGVGVAIGAERVESLARLGGSLVPRPHPFLKGNRAW